ncbi:unnamed protein product [Clonostachys rosea]|uniref:Actin-like ATPase domain-containing protein n=1 Tax=Bionectria ochroleuca TaxID=29856 RepID=A0ABY6UD00_BIOOC|nr:unnamed protein product [Clonostachys rosea]
MAQTCSCAPSAPLTFFIGLDVGVTYSGAYGVLVEHCKEHKVFNVLGHVEVEKFPTLLSRDGLTEVKFLPPKAEVNPDDEILSYFKMGVMDLNDPIFSQADDEVVQGLKDCWKKQPTYVVAPKAFSIFLHGLYHHVIRRSEIVFAAMAHAHVPVKIIATFPACWGQALHRPSIQTAFYTEGAYGVNDMTLEEEHVAALRGLMQSEPDTIQSLRDAKETAIICDIGGLTTDAVVHRFCPIVGASTSPRVWISCLNGGCLIDEEFSKELDREIERHIPEPYRLAHADEMREFKHSFMTQWREKDKLNYDPANYGDSLDFKIREWTLTIQHATFIRLFDQLLEHVVAIIKEAYDKECDLPVKAPTKVILVGGLSRCKYLVSALTEQVAKWGMEICHAPSRSRWNIVALGASYHQQP